MVTDPKHGDSGTSVSAPVVKSVLQYALPRYSIPQTTTKHKVKPIEWGPKSQRRWG